MGKRIRFVVLVFQIFAERYKKYIFVGGIIGFLITLLFLQFYPLYKEVFSLRPQKIGIVGRFNEKTLPLSLQSLISFGLTSLTPSGEATSALALSWTVDNQGISYIFHLYPNLIWHDGKKFRTSDIDYKIKGVTFTSIDDVTLKLTLKDPFSPLPVIVSQPIFKNNLIGLGLYKVNRLQYSGDYISELVLQPQKPGLSNLIYKFYPSTNDALLAFKLGEIDILKNISSLEKLGKWKGIKTIEITRYDRVLTLYLNLKNPLFKEKEIRQALAYAIPPLPNVEKAYTPISPLSWAYTSKIRLYNFDSNVAQKILEKSPISSPSTQLTLTTFSSFLTTAEFIADAWNKIGLNVKVKVESSLPSDYQILLAAQPIPADPDQYQYWQSTQDQTNLSHYSNLKIDKLLEDGRRTTDRTKREKIYSDFQRYLVDDEPVIFLYYPKVYDITRE